MPGRATWGLTRRVSQKTGEERAAMAQSLDGVLSVRNGPGRVGSLSQLRVEEFE